VTRGSRTLLFVLAATAANILITAAAFVLLLVLYGLSLGRILPPGAAAPAIILCFIAAVLLSAFVYKKGLDWARKKWRLEEKLGFSPKRD